MALSLEVYVASRLRDRETIDWSINEWVDRESSENELEFQPLDGEFDSDWDIWQPSKTLSRIIERGLGYQRHAVTVYLSLKTTAGSSINGLHRGRPDNFWNIGCGFKRKRRFYRRR